METKINEAHKKYSLWFYLSAGIIAVIAVLRYKQVIPRIGGISLGADLRTQSIALAVMLCCIPAVLAWFYARSRKIRNMDYPEERIDSYFKAQMIRLAIFDVLALIILAVSVFTTMPNARMAFLMVAAFFFFILPNRVQTLRETGLNADGSIYDPQAEAEAARQEAEARKVGNFTVMDEDDDFIPRNTYAAAVDQSADENAQEDDDDDFIPKNS